MTKEEKKLCANIIQAVYNFVNVIEDLDNDETPDFIRVRLHEVIGWLKYSFDYPTFKSGLRQRILEDITNERI